MSLKATKEMCELRTQMMIAIDDYINENSCCDTLELVDCILKDVPLIKRYKEMDIELDIVHKYISYYFYKDENVKKIREMLAEIDAIGEID